MGNILDNALEAQEHIKEGEKLIDLRFLPQQGYTVILCKNTVCGPVLQKGKLKKTAKSDPESHGLGHRIVESTAIAVLYSRYLVVKRISPQQIPVVTGCSDSLIFSQSGSKWI